MGFYAEKVAMIYQISYFKKINKHTYSDIDHALCNIRNIIKGVVFHCSTQSVKRLIKHI